MRECRTCAHFHGERTGTVKGFEHEPGGLIVCAIRAPHYAVRIESDCCCNWMRASGADDE